MSESESSYLAETYKQAAELAAPHRQAITDAQSELLRIRTAHHAAIAEFESDAQSKLKAAKGFVVQAKAELAQARTQVKKAWAAFDSFWGR